MLRLSADIFWSSYASLWPKILQWMHRDTQEKIWKQVAFSAKKITEFSVDFPVNSLIFKLIQMKPNEAVQSKKVVELKKSLNLLTENIEMSQSNLDSGSLAIHEHYSKLRRDIQLNTELHIEKSRPSLPRSRSSEDWANLNLN